MRRRVLHALVTSLVLCSAARAGAEQTLRPVQPLPEFSACRSTEHPRLPRRWQGVYLMAPFSTGQLVVAKIVHDAALDATRFTLYGVKHGTADFLVVGKATYELASDGETVTHCHELGDTGWRPLPQDWLQRGSQCTGAAPILGTEADWWKTPIAPAPSTYWIWYNRSDGTPLRLVFEAPSDRLGPLSRFALSYQLGFGPLDSTDLAPIAGLCKQATSSSSSSGASALDQRLEAMEHAAERADPALVRLVPGLNPSCPAPRELRWPERVTITGLLTPFDAAEDPAPTEILYDWTLPGQRTRLFPHQSGTTQDALLLGEGGYTVANRRGGAPRCAPGLPGTLRPDWPARAPCSCEAMIAAGTKLTPDEPLQILSCPLALPRIAWAWYGLSGRPRLFMVTSLQQDAGLGDFAALDYSGWKPHRPVPQSAFAPPPQCAIATSRPSAPSHCATCHREQGAK